jgi:hypothetical protein
MGEYIIGTDLNNKNFYFDKDDFEKIKSYYWRIDYWGYVITSIRIKGETTHIKLHKLISNTDKTKHIDHIDGNKTNNRKSNLRFANNQQNAMNIKMFSHNTSGFKGVIWCKDRSKWRAQIKLNQKHMHLGYYSNKEDAIEARIEAEHKYFGEYSYLNRPKELLEV